MSMTEAPLGRLEPPDWEHVENYPLTAPMVEELSERPKALTIGVNWYPAFDRSRLKQDEKGKWWVDSIRPGERRRGGHAVALKPRRATDLKTWYKFYDQVSEGICVGEAVTRMASHNNRKMYQPGWLYAECKKRDGYDGWGTWVRVGLDVLRDLGHVPRRRSERHYFYEDFQRGADLSSRVEHDEGISVYRWITSIDDALAVLGCQDLGYVEILNSWGTYYPQVVRMPAEILDRLWNEHGEIGVATDR